jgi:DNA polymerase I-like protein with 3'-5' exonuclease and polymerase domains
MNILILDVENTVIHRNGRKHLDPFETGNTLVMVGMKRLDELESKVVIFDHSEAFPTENGSNQVQEWLDWADLMVGHNLSHDLCWLWQCGFKYEGKIFDTMLGEYVLLRGQSLPLDLGSVAARYGAPAKQDTLKEYFKKGYTTRDVPILELSGYLRADLAATQGIYEALSARLQTVQDQGLSQTVELTNEVALVLTSIYENGFCVDHNALNEVRREFELEKLELEKKLQHYVRHLMGDTPININSPEQLSWVVFSRKPRNKATWAGAITPYMKDAAFKEAIKRNFDTIYKTKAMQCATCRGTGFINKVKKDGALFKKPTKCTGCSGGYIFQPTKEIAGLKFTPPNAKWASANGFGTDKGNLEILERVATSKGMQEAQEFLTGLRRVSALGSYISNFVEGIQDFLKPYAKQDHSLLHVRLNQHITATGRFSGANPNMQNMPRGKTFPVKRVFKSRWDGGKVMEADFAQLEFRVAAFLSQDSVAIKEVSEGFDVHNYTAKVITDAGQQTSRQVAKMHTFAPLYGATGYGRTPAEAAYYTHFMDKYKGVAKWHKTLATQAVGYRYIKIPSGREYAFPDVQRKRDGTVTYFTQIKNYPVQGFATADIVPLALVEIFNRLKPYRSCVVNSVHDSIVIDVHPEEINDCIKVVDSVQNDLVGLINSKWGIDFNVPLALDAKIGDNWLEQSEVNHS